MQIGDRIKKARLSAGLSQRELATAIGVTHGLIGQWESHRKAPGRETLKRLAKVTYTDVGYILSGGPATRSGVMITDARHLALIRRFDRLSQRQQENLFEFLGVAADVRRELKKQSEPAETE